jgi:hypothetical protein
MEITQQDLDEYNDFMADMQNLAFYANAAWEYKHGTPMFSDNPITTATGFQYKKIQEKLQTEVDTAMTVLSSMTEEQKKELESFEPPNTLPKELLVIPEEMRDLMDVLVINLSLLKEQYRQDTIWLASPNNEVVQPNRLTNAIKNGYHHLDFDDIWKKVEQLKTKRLLIESRSR